MAKVHEQDQIVLTILSLTNMLFPQKSGQMGNNLPEQQVNNNNKAKIKQQTQAQLSSPLFQVLKTSDFHNFENCELNIDIALIYPHLHPPMYQMCKIHTEGPPHACRNMYLWYIFPPASSINKSDLPLQRKAH